MTNFVCTPPCSRITLTVVMETVHIFVVQTSFSLMTKILCISGVQINDLGARYDELAPGVEWSHMGR